MSEQISEKKLQYYLFLLQQAMVRAEKKLAEEIAFFDTHSFYLHYKSAICENGESIEDILNHMEHCIPLALTQKSLEVFLESSQGVDKKQKLNAFFQMAKEDFLQVIAYTKNDKEAFADVSLMCESLRKKLEFL
ncbi:MAG: hypothetical protein R3Y53_06435 [Bacillota bacterium]